VQSSTGFQFRSFGRGFHIAEPRVYTVSQESKFLDGFNVDGAEVLEVQYEAGGLTALFDLIQRAASIPGGSFQALLENLEEAYASSVLILHIRGADRLLADIGPALLHVMTGWEGFTHHLNGESRMYLVLDTGPVAKMTAAFYQLCASSSAKASWPMGLSGAGAEPST
jgi:hypothetical protein